MLERFAVAPSEDAEFMAAWSASAAPGATLHRALREDVRLRFASVAGGAPGAAGGVLLIAVASEGFEAAWEPVREAFARRQGYLGAHLDRDPEGRTVAVVHWSSPLMYARTVGQLGDRLAGLTLADEPAALYVRVR